MPFFTTTKTTTGTRKVNATTNTTITRDMSPADPATKLPTTPELPSKDVREFEHGRQKAKKTAHTQ
ncbi:hypothetical protein EUX98_g193, partial [Antrodiella citrinella]